MRWRCAAPFFNYFLQFTLSLSLSTRCNFHPGWWQNCGLGLPLSGLNFGQDIARRGAFLLTCERLARSLDTADSSGKEANLEVRKREATSFLGVILS